MLTSFVDFVTGLLSSIYAFAWAHPLAALAMVAAFFAVRHLARTVRSVFRPRGIR